MVNILHVLVTTVLLYCYVAARMKMGRHEGCDDGKSHLEVDWDRHAANAWRQYQCPSYPHYTGSQIIKEECQVVEDYPEHMCMNEEIKYEDIPPRSGPHRPVWPVYGEYRYIPPQRWLHSLEHGAVVFLYHPCAIVSKIKKFRRIANECLFRHIITPYRFLTREQPFALIAWKCRLRMGDVDEKEMVDFIRSRARHGPEDLSKDGQYDLDLLEKSRVVSNHNDDTLCPKHSSVRGLFI